jgi:hypothetical protein
VGLPYGSRRTAFVLFLGVSLLYLALARGVLLRTDERQLFHLTEDLVERGDIRRASAADGADGLTQGIGLPLVAAPAWWVADTLLDPMLPLATVRDAAGERRGDERVYGTTLVNALLGGATVALTLLLTLALGYRGATALIVALLLASGTLLVHDSALFRPEPLLALALVTCVYGIVRARLDVAEPERHRGRWLALSGFAAGLALATQPGVSVALLPVALWMIWLLGRKARSGGLSAADMGRAALLWSGPVAGWLAVTGWANWERFGAVANIGEAGTTSLVDTTAFEGIYGLLLSPGRGVLWYNPPLWLALLGFGLFVVRRPGLGLTIAGMLAATVVYHASGDVWHGGAVWGPNYLVPLLPLLILPVAEVIEPIFGAAERRAALVVGSIVGIVALVALAITALGVVVPYDRYVAEYSTTPAAFRAALFEPDASPVAIHTQRFMDEIDTPDLAARRYDSTALWVVAALAALLGLLCLVQATRWTIRPPQPPEPVVRMPPLGWDDQPRC